MDAKVDSPEVSSAGSTSIDEARPRPYAWYALTVLTLSYAMACVDRFAFNIVLEPMRMELHASDTQMGFLAGAAFVLFYAALGVPMARLADRGDRRLLLSAAVSIWSVLTLLTGFSASVLQAGLARIGLGVAEAAGAPASLSLIAELFTRARRGFAVSIYQSGMAISGLIGSPIVGIVAHAYGWRAAFWVLSIPGLFLGLIILTTLREPRRTMAQGGPRPIPARGALARDVRLLFGDRRFRLLFLSQLLVGIPTGVLPIWLTALMMRDFGMDLRGVALLSTLFYGVIMLIAFSGSGYVISHVVARTGSYHHGALIPGLLALASVPFAVLMLLAQSLGLAILFASIFFFLLFTSRPAGNVLALDFAPAALRGLAIAIMLLATSLVGGGVGPVLVGLVSDHFAPAVGRADALRWALMCAVPVEVFGSALLFCAIGGILKKEQRGA